MSILTLRVLNPWGGWMGFMKQSPNFFCRFPYCLHRSISIEMLNIYHQYIDSFNLYICTMYLFHINSIKYVYSTFHSISQQMIFRGISILLDIKIFRIHGRFGLFKAFKTFQTEMKLPFFDPSLELFSQLVCLFHFHLFFNRNFPR